MTTYTHEQLQAMQRRDLQALAKKYDVRANGKTTEIIADLMAVLQGGDAAARKSESVNASPKSKSESARSRSASPRPKTASGNQEGSPASKSARSRSPSKSPKARMSKSRSRSPSPKAPAKSRSRSPSPKAAAKSRSRSPSPKAAAKLRSRSPSPAKSPRKIPEALAQEIKEASANRSPVPTLPKPTEEMKSIHKELKRKAEELSPGGSPKKARAEDNDNCAGDASS